MPLFSRSFTMPTYLLFSFFLTIFLTICLPVAPLIAQESSRLVPVKKMISGSEKTAIDAGSAAKSASAASTVKWEELFDSTVPPAGWTVFNSDSSMATDSSDTGLSFVQSVIFNNGQTVNPDTGTSFWHSSFLNANDDGLIDEWLITPLLPEIEAGDSIHFMAGAVGDSFHDSLFVRISTTGAEPDSFRSTLAGVLVPGPTGSWHEFKFPLRAFTGRQIYIGINYRIVDGGRFGNHSDNVWIDYFRLTNDSTIITGIGDRPVAGHTFQLHQNYPNPFNPETRIRYQISDIRYQNGNARLLNLSVFDIRGRKVRTLLNKIQPPGSYSVSWDGRDDGGRKVASGIYYYRLQVGPFNQTRKMLLLR